MKKNIFLIESSENSICLICGHPLKHRDLVKWIMKGKEGAVRWLRIHRLICTNESCHSMHRELPVMPAPHKHFEIDIIAGVPDAMITPDTKGFEDHKRTSKRRTDNKSVAGRPGTGQIPDDLPAA